VGSLSAAPAPAGRLPGLDTLRALAIVWVLTTHYSGFVSGRQTFGWFGSVGWAGVDLFFVLSGYLIGRQIALPLARGEAWSAGRFFARRLLRTLPNYLVVLAAYLLWPGPPLGGSVTAPLWRFLTFTQNFGLAYGETFTHSWSLCIEEQFYLALPVAALAFARWGRSPAVAWAALAAGIAGGIAARGLAFLHGHDAFDARVYYATLCRFDELLPGVALALLESFHPDLFAAVRRHGRALTATGLLASAAVLYGIANERPSPFLATTFGYSLLALAFAVLVLAALSPASPLHRLRVPGAAPLARWSYAIYLVHKPLFMVLAPQLAHRGLDPSSVPVIAATMAAGVGAGWGLFRLVETPFMRLRARWFPSRRAHGGEGMLGLAAPCRGFRPLP
jgi:peptidoglycan/LPS O-acetylase OafA/YrhL